MRLSSGLWLGPPNSTLIANVTLLLSWLSESTWQGSRVPSTPTLANASWSTATAVLWTTTEGRREVCGASLVIHSVTKKARGPDNASCGVLRHAQERLLRREGLLGRNVRGVLGEAGRLHRVVPEREAEGVTRMEYHQAAQR